MMKLRNIAIWFFFLIILGYLGFSIYRASLKKKEELIIVENFQKDIESINKNLLMESSFHLQLFKDRVKGGGDRPLDIEMLKYVEGGYNVLQKAIIEVDTISPPYDQHWKDIKSNLTGSDRFDFEEVLADEFELIENPLSSKSYELNRYKSFLIYELYNYLLYAQQYIGASDISFSDPMGILAARGSQSKSVEGLDSLLIREIIENQWIETEIFPTSFVYPTYSEDSYSEFISSILESRLPDPTQIQIQDIVNKFQYSTENDLSVEIMECPWVQGEYLLLIEFVNEKGHIISELNYELTFDEEEISAFRLLGQEGLYIEGFQATAYKLNERDRIKTLYQVKASELNKIGLIRINYLEEGKQVSMEHILSERITEANVIPSSAALAELALIIRDSEYKGEADLKRVIRVLSNSEFEELREFSKMVERYGELYELSNALLE